MYSRAGRSSRTQVASNAETQFVFNTFSFLVWGALVMWMCAGFTMLESGSVRTKNASVICLKNIGLYAIAGLAYYFIGYNLMYVDVGSLIGSVTLFYGPSADEVALLAGQESARDAVIANNYAVMSNWFFQMVFVAAAGSLRWISRTSPDPPSCMAAAAGRRSRASSRPSLSRGRFSGAWICWPA